MYICFTNMLFMKTIYIFVFSFIQKLYSPSYQTCLISECFCIYFYQVNYEQWKILSTITKKNYNLIKVFIFVDDNNKL